MGIIHIDGRDFEAHPQDNLLKSCLSLGLDLPYFCWHPALGSVGACRQCAVKQFANADDQKGRIVMACMTPSAEGARISITDPEAKAFRASVIEWLMTNHPHDCPVCEEGGECHLQDMTVMTGHNYRRYRFDKRTHHNQYLGPFIKHEMNRCIACYRCVRFYRDYAGGSDLDVFAAHNNVYFGRAEDGVLENEFSGNLVEVCPTGVFTDKTFSARYSRKWDLRSTPSVCVHCGLGCNTMASERAGQLRRILNRYNGDVNRYFLCDRGRFGYEFVNSPSRIRAPLMRGKTGEQIPAGKSEALEQVSACLSEGRVIGIGSPRASLEANFALRKFVGPDCFYAGVSRQERACLSAIIEILQGPVKALNLREVEAADAVLVLGEDVPNSVPRLALALRQSVRQATLAIADQLKIPHWQDAAVREAAGDLRSPLFVATPAATRLDDIASATCRAAPDDIARLGFAIAHCIDPDAPPVTDLSRELQDQADQIADALMHAERPLVVAGCQLGSEAALHAAANIAWALHRTGREASIFLTVPECNSLGLALMQGASLADAAEAIKDGAVSALIVLENDLYRRVDRATADALLGAVEHLVVIDHVVTETTEKAEIVLPAATFAESDGTLVNNESRAQRFFQLIFSKSDVQESWAWLRDAYRESGSAEANWERLDDVIASLALALPAFALIGAAAPAADFRIAGSRIRSEPHRFSGRTAVHADSTVFEPKPPANGDAPFSTTMEGYYGEMPAPLIPYFWAPSWNSVQSLNKFQDEIGGALRGGDAGVRLIEPQPGTAIPYYQDIPRSFMRQPDQWLIVPLPYIFGDEELSALSPAIAERVQSPRAALNSDDARMLAIDDGMTVDVVLDSARYRLPVDIRQGLPGGVIGISNGLSGCRENVLPGWASIHACASTGDAP